MYPLFDLTKFITNLVGYAYYAGWVVVGVSVILSVYYFALMHDSENGKRALTFTIAAAAVLLGGFAAITSIAQSPAPSFQGAEYVSLFAYAGVAICVVAAAVNFAVQRPDRALGYLAAGIVIFAALAAGALAQPSMQGFQQPPFMTGSVNPTSCNAPCTVTISGTLAPANYNPAPVTVYWGDNTSSSTTTGANGVFSISHKYGESGQYTIEAVAYAANQTASLVFLVQVENSVSNSGLLGSFLGSIEAHAAGYFLSIFKWISSGLTAAFEYMILMPVFGGSTWPGSVMSELYSVVERYAIGFVGVFVLADVLWTVFWKGAEDIEETVIRFAKEVIVVLLVIFTAPLFYNALAYLLNPLSAYLLHLGNPGGIVAYALTIAGALSVASFVSPAIGMLAGLILFSLILIIVFAFIRFLLIGAFLISAPVLAVLWLFPPLRRVVDFAAEIMIGLTIMGVIAAAVLALLGSFINQAPIQLRIPLVIASPFFVDMIPFALSFLSLGGAGNIFGGWGGRIAGAGRLTPSMTPGMTWSKPTQISQGEKQEGPRGYTDVIRPPPGVFGADVLGSEAVSAGAAAATGGASAAAEVAGASGAAVGGGGGGGVVEPPPGPDVVVKPPGESTASATGGGVTVGSSGGGGAPTSGHSSEGGVLHIVGEAVSSSPEEAKGFVTGVMGNPASEKKYEGQGG